jgi:hypothetical protein
MPALFFKLSRVFIRLVCRFEGAIPPLLVLFWRMRMDEPESFQKYSMKRIPLSALVHPFPEIISLSLSDNNQIHTGIHGSFCSGNSGGSGLDFASAGLSTVNY